MFSKIRLHQLKSDNVHFYTKCYYLVKTFHLQVQILVKLDIPKENECVCVYILNLYLLKLIQLSKILFLGKIACVYIKFVKTHGVNRLNARINLYFMRDAEIFELHF